MWMWGGMTPRRLTWGSKGDFQAFGYRVGHFNNRANMGLETGLRERGDALKMFSFEHK